MISATKYVYSHARRMQFIKLTTSTLNIFSNKIPIISTAGKSVKTFYFLLFSLTLVTHPPVPIR